VGVPSNRGAFTVYHTRVLVAADGADSMLARSLGYVSDPPDTIGASTFTEENTHALRADHVEFYPTSLLPGHLVMANGPNGVLHLSCFMGKNARKSQITREFKDLTGKDPLISKSLGTHALLHPLQIAPMRIKKIPRTYGDHFVIIGEAAGHVDAFTREGIHYGMDGAQMAADVIVEGLLDGDVSEVRLKEYEDKWRKKFHWDFYFSAWLCRIVQRHPIVLDAAVAVVKRRGVSFITSWALVTAGVKSKLWLARPDVGWMIALEAFLIWMGHIGSWLLH